jgi:hypothetical protein
MLQIGLASCRDRQPRKNPAALAVTVITLPPGGTLRFGAFNTGYEGAIAPRPSANQPFAEPISLKRKLARHRRIDGSD